jgi:hypothetical protein
MKNKLITTKTVTKAIKKQASVAYVIPFAPIRLHFVCKPRA